MKTSIRHRRSRRKIKRDFDLQLTSMMDMLIILVVFLLKSYSSNAISFNTSANISLPMSNADEAPADAISLIIDPTNITVDGEKVLDFASPITKPVAMPSPGTVSQADSSNKQTKAQVIAAASTVRFEDVVPPHLLSDGGRRILPLYDALVRIREKTELLMNKATFKDASGKTVPPQFHGTVIIQADKSAPYELLRKVMYTAGAAEFKTFKLLTIKKET